MKKECAQGSSVRKEGMEHRRPRDTRFHLNMGVETALDCGKEKPGRTKPAGFCYLVQDGR